MATALPARKEYTHTQAVASNSWNINHNLDFFPLVDIFSVGGIKIDAQIVHVDNNNVQINFNSVFSGYAILK